MNTPARLGSALVALLTLAAPARADEPRRTSIQMRVGETRTLGTFGGHRSDCVTSVRPNTVDVTADVALGTIARRENAPYTARESLSGTCLGSHFLGTAIDFTARRPGVETVDIVPTFDNGQARRVITVTITP